MRTEAMGPSAISFLFLHSSTHFLDGEKSTLEGQKTCLTPFRYRAQTSVKRGGRADRTSSVPNQRWAFTGWEKGTAATMGMLKGRLIWDKTAHDLRPSKQSRTGKVLRNAFILNQTLITISNSVTLVVFYGGFEHLVVTAQKMRSVSVLHERHLSSRETYPQLSSTCTRIGSNSENSEGKGPWMH